MGQLLIHTLQVGLEKLSSCNLAAITRPNPVKSTDIGAWKLLDLIHERGWENSNREAFYHSRGSGPAVVVLFQG